VVSDAPSAWLDRYWLRFALALGGLCVGAFVLGAGDVQATPAPATDTSGFVGDWAGTLTVGSTDLRVVFRLRTNADGRLTGTMDSPDQGATGIPIGRILVDADTLRLAVPSIAGRFAGVLRDSAQVLDGQWVQGGRPLPLRLERTENAPTVRRPQEPTLPLPYASETVTFRNEAAGVTLAGTLTRPQTEAPVPGVVLVAGSGPSDRNATIMGHKPFLVLADALTRRGLAVLRFDERGVGQSGGTQEGATTADLSGDVEAAVEALARREGVAASEIGIIGHSEGGLIAPMVATRTDDVAFLVLLAAPGLPGDAILANQLERRIQRQGANRRTRALQRGTQDRIFEVLKQDADSAEIASQLERIMVQAQGISGEAVIEREIQRLMDPWLRFFIRHDPRPVLRKVDVPVLALAGEKDQQVAPDTNQAAIAEALNATDDSTVTVRTLDGLNHLFQTAESGAPSEYGRIEETFAPTAIDVIADWIDEQVGLSTE
jgi:pimeloyl-ACP methyl ester carboxylesterase